MNPARYLIAVVAAGTLTVAVIAINTTHDRVVTGSPTLAGIGGAGAFITPNVDGPFVTSGPLAGIGGAGAFITPNVSDPVGAGGPLAGIGGAGAFITPST